jgi:hypothetical protein
MFLRRRMLLALLVGLTVLLGTSIVYSDLSLDDDLSGLHHKSPSMAVGAVEVTGDGAGRLLATQGPDTTTTPVSQAGRLTRLLQEGPSQQCDVSTGG